MACDDGGAPPAVAAAPEPGEVGNVGAGVSVYEGSCCVPARSGL